MVRVILTDNPNDRGGMSISAQVDCACDCDCACPVDGASGEGDPIPVLSLPVAYYLELTPACQNRCPGCGNVYAADRTAASVIARCALGAEAIPNSETTLPPLDGPAWRALLARLAPHTHHLKLTGGEPTLHPDFAAILRAIDGHGIPFALFSNGRWADPEATLRLLRDTPTCDGLLVSLHGPDAPTHEAFSGVPGSFRETAANVRRAVEAGLDVATSLVLTRHNVDRVEETLALALELGANHVVCNRWIGTTDNAIAPRDDQLRTAITDIEVLRAAGRPIRFGNCIPQCFAPSSSKGCTAGSTFATIDPWGRMRPCNHAPWVAGDLRTQSVEAAWQGAVMEAWRALVPEGCAGCAAYARCHGGCRAQGVLAGMARDPLVGEAVVAVPEEEVLRLYGGLRPVGRFVRREEGGRDVLIYKSQVAAVPDEWQELWSRLDGALTLHQIERQCRDHAVMNTAELYRRGMVAWVDDSL